MSVPLAAIIGCSNLFMDSPKGKKDEQEGSISFQNLPGKKEREDPRLPKNYANSLFIWPEQLGEHNGEALIH